MKKIISILLLIIFIVVIIFITSLPFLLSFKEIHIFTEIERALLTIIIATLSVFLGFIISRIKDKSIKKWTSAFISACNSLIAMSVQAENVKKSHEILRKKIEDYIPDDDDAELVNLKNIFDLRCNFCAEHMDHLKMQIDSSLEHLENMIDSLCDDPYCSQLHNAINKKKQKFNMGQKDDIL